MDDDDSSIDSQSKPPCDSGESGESEPPNIVGVRSTLINENIESSPVVPVCGLVATTEPLLDEPFVVVPIKAYTVEEIVHLDSVESQFRQNYPRFGGFWNDVKQLRDELAAFSQSYGFAIRTEGKTFKCTRAHHCQSKANLLLKQKRSRGDKKQRNRTTNIVGCKFCINYVKVTEATRNKPLLAPLGSYIISSAAYRHTHGCMPGSSQLAAAHQASGRHQRTSKQQNLFATSDENSSGECGIINEQQCGKQCIIKLILVRHGIALHNVIQQQQQQQNPPGGTGDDDENEFLFDPPLTMEGKIQSLMVGETIRNFLQLQQPSQQQRRIQYRILTSPLTRCLQTSVYAFGVPNEYCTNDNDNENNINAITTGTTTIQCHDMLREACGIYNCDRRRTKTQLQHHWGHVAQFLPDSSDSSTTTTTTTTTTMSDDDVLWSKTRRETIYELQCRITQFMVWLLSSSSSSSLLHYDTTSHQSQQQPQQQNDDSKRNNDMEYVILITHGVWMETMFQMYDPTWTNGTTQRVQNADVFVCECTYSGPSATATTTTTTGIHTNNSNIQLQNVQQIHHERHYSCD